MTRSANTSLYTQPGRLRWRRCLGTLSMAMSLGLVPLAQAEIPTIEWNHSLKQLQVDNDKFIGQRFRLRCPEHTVRDTDAALRGTDRYPSDSAICVAAVHAGVVDRSGGEVVVQLNPAPETYVGSERNGVVSASFPKTTRSITFVEPSQATIPDATQRAFIPRLKWDSKFTTTGLAKRNLVGQHFAFKCPPASGNLMARSVYGTDRYAFNSYVCQAAVHAGRLTHDGGLVLIQLHEGVPRLEGSIRNGIESRSGPGGSRTLSFLPIAGTATVAAQ